MKYCPKCGAEVAEEATACPKCGYPLKRKRKWGDVFGGIGLGFSIFAFICGILACIPLIGLAFGYIAVVVGTFSLIFSIIGCIGAVSKRKCITGIVFSALAIGLSIVGFVILAGIAAAATAA